MNLVVLQGNLTKDPELSFTAGKGTPKTEINVAVRRDKENTDFIKCITWNKTAETIAQCFTKGMKICVQGNIKTGSYEANDGTKRYTTDVWIEKFEFVESKKQGASEKPKEEEFEMTPVDDGDIPF